MVLYTTPTQYIADVITTTNIVDSRGRIFYQVVCNKTEGNKSVAIQMRDKDGEIVANASSNDMKGYIEIEDVKPWWPYLMHPEPGYLYTMEVKTMTTKSNAIQMAEYGRMNFAGVPDR